MEQMVQVGSIRKPHGLKGELKVHIEERYHTAFLASGVVFTEQSGQYLPYFIVAVKGETGDIVQLEEVSSREAAEDLVGKRLYLRETELTVVEDHLYETWMGFEVRDSTTGTLIGTISRVVEYPQQWMAFVATVSGKEAMVPLVEAFIVSVQVPEKRITLELPEGLLDL